MIENCITGRSGGKNSLLALVDLDVPLAPDLGGSEHATRSAHVTKSSLTSTVSTATRDTRNTGDSATCEVVSSQPKSPRYQDLFHCNGASDLVSVPVRVPR